MADEEERTPFWPNLPGFRPYPTTTTPDGVVQVDEGILAAMRQMTPEQREIFEAYMLAGRPDPEQLGAAPPRRLVDPEVLTPPPLPVPEPDSSLTGGTVPPASMRRPSGKVGTQDIEEADNIYHFFGTVGQDGMSIERFDGATVWQLPPNAAYDPNTRRVYYIPESTTDRMTFLPFAMNQATGQSSFAMPQAIQGAIDSIERMSERLRRGLVVPDSVLAQEAMEVSGLAQTGGWGVGRMLARDAETAVTGVRPLSPTPALRLGTAGGGSAPVARRPQAEAPPVRPELDQGGFFSQAERAALEVVPSRSTGQDILGSMLNRGGVREVEVQQLGLDTHLLGPELAPVRRSILEREARLAEIRSAITRAQQNLQKAEASEDTAAITLARQQLEFQQDRQAVTTQLLRRDQTQQAELRKTHPPQQFTRDQIIDFIRANRVRTVSVANQGLQIPVTISHGIGQINRTAGDLNSLRTRLTANARRPVGLREADDIASMITGALDDTTLNEVQRLRLAMDRVEIFHPELTPAVRRWAQEVSGLKLDDVLGGQFDAPRPTVFGQYIADQGNPTLREVSLHIDDPHTQRALAILESIPEAPRARITTTWGMDAAQMADADIPMPIIDEVLNYRQRYARAIEQLTRLEREHNVFTGGHFYASPPSTMGFAMTTMHTLPDGRKAMFVNQLQSDWTNALDDLRTVARHVTTSSLQRWVDPMMGRMLREAIDQGAEAIILPNGASVNRYNRLPDTIQALYDRVYHRRLSEVMRQIDRSSGTPRHFEGGLPSHNGQNLLNVEGWIFDIPPQITRHFRTGGGTRILTGGPAGVASAAAGSEDRRARR